MIPDHATTLPSFEKSYNQLDSCGEDSHILANAGVHFVDHSIQETILVSMTITILLILWILFYTTINLLLLCSSATWWTIFYPESTSPFPILLWTALMVLISKKNLRWLFKRLSELTSVMLLCCFNLKYDDLVRRLKQSSKIQSVWAKQFVITIWSLWNVFFWGIQENGLSGTQ